MNNDASFCGGLSRPTRLVASILLLLVSQALGSRAQTVTMNPGDNSSVVVDTSGGAGVTNWTVEGQNLLNNQWFYSWTSGAVNTMPQGLQSIGAVVNSVVSHPSTDTSTFTSTYGNTGSGVSAQVNYTLSGGASGSGVSDLQETITIQNHGATSLNQFHFFQYASFNIANPNVALGVSGLRSPVLYNEALVTSGNVLIHESVDGVLSPGATHGTIAPPSLATFTGTSGYTVGGVPVQVSGAGGSWLLEWDVTIPVGGTFQVSKDLNVQGVSPVPEPSTWALLSLSLLGFGAVRRFRRAA